MAKFARFDEADGGGWRTALEVVEAADAEALALLFHPTIVAMFEPAPDEAVAGSRRHGDSWSHPEPAEPPPPAPEPEVNAEVDTTVADFVTGLGLSQEDHSNLLAFVRSQSWYASA